MTQIGQIGNGFLNTDTNCHKFELSLIKMN